MKLSSSLPASLALALAALAAGCASQAPAPSGPGDPPTSGERRGTAAAAALGDAGSADYALEKPRAGATAAPAPSDEGLARADALAKDGRPAAAAEAYEQVYRLTPRSKKAEDALFSAAEACFAAGRHYHALELLEKLLFEYPQTPHYPEAVQRIFQIGKLYVEETAKKPTWILGIELTNRDFGIEILEKFVRTRERHELSPQALFLVGQAHKDADEPELAIESWQRLVKEYPQSPWARVAEYRIALAFISLSYGVDYDKRPLMTGLRRLRAYVRKYPTGDNIQEAEQKVARLEEELAAQQLRTAKEYATASHVPGHGIEAIKSLFRPASETRYVSARVYLNAIRREYPKTQAAVEAARLSAEWPDPKPPELDGFTEREKEKEGSQ